MQGIFLYAMTDTPSIPNHSRKPKKQELDGKFILCGTAIYTRTIDQSQDFAGTKKQLGMIARLV